MIADEVLALLRCPTTRQSLRPATALELSKIPSGPAEALVREDGRAAYPIRDGIPMLTPESAIALGES